MPAKKQLSLTPEEQEQTQQLLAHYREIDEHLTHSHNREQEEQALTPLTSLSEVVQLASLKALSKENTVEAANVLAAINEFTPIKEVRKEARRSLIHLESSRIYPHWLARSKPLPIELVAQSEPENSTPPRFWKGIYTDSRDAGEMQLLLFWEQGEGYRQARMMGFLLDLWHDGVKDFFTEVHSKRHMEKHIEEASSQFVGIDLVNCTLAQGRQLLEEGLDVNKKFNTRPHSDYTRHLPLIRQLIFDDPEATIDDDTSTISTTPSKLSPASNKTPSSPFDMLSSLLGGSELSEELSAFESFFSGMIYKEVISKFLESWTEGDYPTAYDLLSSDSPLRDGLSQDEWSELRSQWSVEAQPANFKATFISDAQNVLELEDDEDEDDEGEIEDDLIDEIEEDEDEDEDDEIEDTQPEIEAGWSLEYIDTPLAKQLKELPVATTSYKETNRHWLWASYTLVQEDGEWLIHDMQDKGAEAITLAREDLELRLNAIQAYASTRFKETLERAGIDPNKQELTDEDLDQLADVEDEDDDEEDLEDAELLDTLDELQDAFQLMTQGLHYYDALIALDPNIDADIYLQAADSCSILQDYERAAIYLQPLVDHFPDERSEALKKLALSQLEISSQYGETDEARENHFIDLAEISLRETLKVDDTATAYISLAELLIDPREEYDEAEALLKQAETHSPNDAEQSLIENARARIAEANGNNEEALLHYQHAAESNSKLEGVWYQMGRLQFILDRKEEAEQNLLRSIEQDAELTSAYVALASIYIEQPTEHEKAIDILEQGLEVNEQSADILAQYAVVLMLAGRDLDEAEAYLEQAEEIDPEMPLVLAARQLFDTHKAEQRAKRKSKGAQHKKQKGKSNKSKRR